jgi:hypothetical protein
MYIKSFARPGGWRISLSELSGRITILLRILEGLVSNPGSEMFHGFSWSLKAKAEIG